jgi:hypothetical protein
MDHASITDGGAGGPYWIVAHPTLPAFSIGFSINMAH